MFAREVVRSCMMTMLLLGASSGAIAQSSMQQRSQTDEIFAAWDKPGLPGCAVGIIRDGELVFERGYGMANLDYDIPLTSQSVFYIASTSKQFAAASIGLLALRGNLSLDDPVSKHIPEFPAYDYPVTIRHLIHHTSGVRDYLALRSIAGKSFEDFFDISWAVDLIARQQQLNFEPGAEFLYSNSGYLLLAEIVGRVTGQSLSEYGRDTFFVPLGMDATHWGGDRQRVVPDRVVSYDKRDDGTYRRYVKNFHAMGDGNLLTTVEDLVKWDQLFYDTTDVWRPLIDLMHTRGVLNTGDTLDYAFGLFEGEYRNRRTVRHGGAFLGFRTEMLRFPDDRFTAVVLCNFGSANPGSYAEQLADIWLFRSRPQIADRNAGGDVDPPIDLPRVALGKFVGVYSNPDSPVGDAVVALEETKLTLEVAGVSFSLLPTASNRFRSEAGPVELILEFETDAEHQMLRVVPRGGEPIMLTRSNVQASSPLDPASFRGTFHSPELDATFVVTPRGDELYVERTDSEDAILRPVSEDQFTMSGWTILFTRDVRGAVDGFLLDAGRVRGLRFVKRS